MMASSSLLGFYFIFFALCIVIELVWWAPKMMGVTPAQFYGFGFRLVKTVGTSVLVKTILLDKFVGRKILTKNGFVVLDRFGLTRKRFPNDAMTMRPCLFKVSPLPAQRAAQPNSCF